MADTKRTLTSLLALFADNTSGDISAQDARDLIVSIIPAWGSMYISSSALTALGTATDTKAAGTTSSVSLKDFDMPANNRLRYIGSPDIHIHGALTWSATIASGTNKTLNFMAYRYDDSAGSGAVLEHSRVSSLFGNTDERTGAIHFDVTLSTNDYVEFWISNETDGTDATVTFMYMFIMGMISN